MKSRPSSLADPQMDLIQLLHWEAERLRDVYNHWARVANLEGTWTWEQP